MTSKLPRVLKLRLLLFVTWQNFFFLYIIFPNNDQKVLKWNFIPSGGYMTPLHIKSKLRSYQLSILKALHGNIKYPVSSGIHTNGVFQTSCVLLRNRKGGF